MRTKLKKRALDRCSLCKRKYPLLKLDKLEVLKIKAVGSGNRQMCLMDKIGFQRTKAKAAKKSLDLKHMVKAIVSSGKKVHT